MCYGHVKGVIDDVRNGRVTVLIVSLSVNAGKLGQWWQTFCCARQDIRHRQRFEGRRKCTPNLWLNGNGRCGFSLSRDAIRSRRGSTWRLTFCEWTSFTCCVRVQGVANDIISDCITFLRAVLVANSGKSGHRLQMCCFSR